MYQFYGTIDTVIMGKATYIFGADRTFPYKGKKCYVFSGPLPAAMNTRNMSRDIGAFVKER